MCSLNTLQLPELSKRDEEFFRNVNELYKTLGIPEYDVNGIQRRSKQIEHVEQILPLLEKIAQVLKPSEVIDLLCQSLRTAKKNNLNIAIMGTMKAGKSTLISATAGFNVAPARNSAATSFIIQFEYDSSLKEPKMEVPECFQQATFEKLHKVCEVIKKDGLAKIESQLNVHPQARALLSKIISKEIDKDLRSIPTGSDEINTWIEQMNDLYRIFFLLKIKSSLITEYPVVYTPFYGIDKELEGVVTLNDMPGENEVHSEYHESSKLILAQTQKIILVANYGELQTEAFNAVLKLCNNIIQLRDKDSLLIVVNQVDRRQTISDMTKEEVTELFINQLGIESNQVIEVSSSQALLASSIRRDSHISPLRLNQKESVKQLAEKYHGLVNADNWLQNANREEILALADKEWKRSGFQQFTDIIASWIENSKHETVKSALTLGKNCLQKGLEDIKTTQELWHENEQRSSRKLIVLEEQISESERQLEDLLKTGCSSFIQENKNQTKPILSVTSKFYTSSEASAFLEENKNQFLQTTTQVWDETLKKVSDGSKKIVSDLINQAKALGLQPPSIELQLPSISFSIDGLSYESFEEAYDSKEQRPRYRTVRREVKVGERWVYDVWPIFGHHVDVYKEQEFQEQDGYEDVNVTRSRNIYLVPDSLRYKMNEQIELQVAKLLSESLQTAVFSSLEAFKTHLEEYKTTRHKKFAEDLKTLRILEVEAQDKLNLLEADLASIQP